VAVLYLNASNLTPPQPATATASKTLSLDPNPQGKYLIKVVLSLTTLPSKVPIKKLAKKPQEALDNAEKSAEESGDSGEDYAASDPKSDDEVDEYLDVEEAGAEEVSDTHWSLTPSSFVFLGRGRVGWYIHQLDNLVTTNDIATRCGGIGPRVA
jgi:hypothetical protein